MPRRKSGVQEVQNSPVKRWNTATYIRLSKDEIGKNESDSIINQRAILNEFLSVRTAEFNLLGEYVDDGHTGTDSDRERFAALLRDIEMRKINCVLVKDLSRFARNYYEAGYYIENLFTRLDVRFICLSNPYLDSYLHPEQMDSIAIPIQNVMNDDFCRQTSLKVRSVFDYKRRQGQFIGAFAAYGYRKSSHDKHRLEIDEEAAQTVRRIYQWYLAGKSKLGIARKLNLLGIPNPSAYKRMKGLAYHSSVKDPSPLWSEKTIAQILQNEIYIGNMIQGKQRVRSYKVHTQIRVPRSEWFVVENTHDPIIDFDSFQMAQSLQKKDICVPAGHENAYLFSGLLCCGDCQKAMHRKSAREIVYYECRTYKESGRTQCEKHSIRHTFLEIAVLSILQKLIDISVEKDELLQNIRNIPPPVLCHTNTGIEEIQRTLRQIETYRKGLYESLKDGDLNREEYRRLKTEYTCQEQFYNQRLQQILKEQEKQDLKQESKLYRNFVQYGNFSVLNRELLVTLVDKICIYRNRRIQIQFKCCNTFNCCSDSGFAVAPVGPVAPVAPTPGPVGPVGAMLKGKWL